MRLDSIRSRTLVLVLGVLSLSLTLISWRSYHDAEHEIEELFDAYLAHASRLVEGMVGRGMTTENLDSLQLALDSALAAAHHDEESPEHAEGHRYESKLAFMVLDEQGGVLLRSASAPDDLLSGLDALPAPEGGRPQLSQALTGFHNVSLHPYQWRVFLREDRADGYWIVVAERADVRGELVDGITLRTMLPDLLGLPLLALLVWIAIGLGLRPLSHVASLIKSRDPENLAPLRLDPMPPELEPMVLALNRLFDQVTSLLEREKRFIADAAHELRTPLAVLHIHAENALQLPACADREVALRQVISGVERATRLVNQMLTLARLEPGALPQRMTEFDLLPYVRNELAELIPLALDRDIELGCEAGDAQILLHADAPSVGILLQNLVSNAVQYTPSGGQVLVSLQLDGEQVLLRVGDTGPGVPVEEREQLFRRFHRQTNTGQGAGLGLAIVQRITELHGGSVSLGDSVLGGLEVIIRLPRHGRGAVAAG